MNIEILKREYENASELQSYDKMKKVAQRLLNYYNIEESQIYTKYTQYITFRGEEYQIDVEFDSEPDNWYFVVTDTKNAVHDYGTISGENEIEVLDKIKTNFDSHIKLNIS